MNNATTWIGCLACVLGVLALPPVAVAQDGTGGTRFEQIDVFGLEYASDPQVSPDGRQIVYVRNFMDIMEDRRRSTLWIVNADGTGHRPLTTGNENDTTSTGFPAFRGITPSTTGRARRCRWWATSPPRRCS